MRRSGKQIRARQPSVTRSTQPSWAAQVWETLSKPRNVGAAGLNRRELTFLLKSLATLTENGVSLPKAIATLAREKGLEKHRELLSGLCKAIENGEAFSSALAQRPHTFDSIMVKQVKVGERTGTIAETLRNIADHREKSGRLRSEVLRKLSYPILLVTVGSGVITFLLMYVVPVFQDTYDEAGIDLPMVTKLLIGLGYTVRTYGWVAVLAAAGMFLLVTQLRRKPQLAYRMDAAMLSMPLFGHWLRDIAVLQLMEVLGNLMEAGFTLAEALGESSETVGNRAVQRSAIDLQAAVKRGERFSSEIERLGDTFPPIVSQLVIVGEQTGKLVVTTRHIRTHLEQEIERKTNIMVGTLEPLLTIALAISIGIILLAIYLPMFDMINAVGV